MIEERKGFLSAIKPSGNWFHNKKLLLVVSLLISVSCWVFVTLYVNADSERIISDVPIRIDTSAMEENFGLQMISINEPLIISDGKINVTVKGSVYQISQVTMEDVAVIAQTSSVSKADTYQLSLSVTCSNKNVTVTLENNVTNITVWFDRIQQKDIELDKPLANGATTTTDGDLEMGESYGSIKKIRVEGPESVMSMISGVQLRADISRTLTETEDVPATICYLDESNELLDTNFSKYITIIDYNDLEETQGTAAGAPVSDDVKITIPIKKIATLPIRLQYKNVPEGFDTGTLKPKLTPSSVTIKGEIDAINRYIEMGCYPLESIDLQSLTPERANSTLKLNLSSGIEAEDAVSEISVSFNLNGYKTKTVELINNGSFKLINSANANTVISTAKLSITVSGPSAIVDSIEAGDIIVSVDMSDDDGTAGSKSKTAILSVKNTSCWIVSSYSLTVQVPQQ